MKEKIIIGRDYWPSQTLRRMPSGWQLSEAKRRGEKNNRFVWWACSIMFATFYLYSICRAF